MSIRISQHALRHRRVAIFAAISFALSATLVAHSTAYAQAFPGKPIKLVVAFSAGSGTDTFARLVAPLLEAKWKQPVIVENRPGASGLIGAEYVARAQPDGHTLLVGSQSVAMAKLTSANVKFDPQVELAPVYKHINYKVAFAANAQLKGQAANLRDLATLSNKSGSVFFGGTGPSSVFTISNAMISHGLGLKYEPVDFPGPPQMMLALARSDVQYVVNTTQGIQAQLDSGAVYPIGVLSEERYSDMPNVPTVREAGYKGYLPQVWNGVFSPRGTPPDVKERIARDLESILLSPENKAAFERKLGGTLLKSSPQAFAKDLEQETKQWREFFVRINFKPQ